MKLLSSPRPAFLHRPLASVGGWYTVGLAGLLVGLEVVGRSAGSDLHDALAMLLLAAAAAATVTRHQRTPLPWLSWLGGKARRAWKRAERLKHHHGIDLRGDPPIPHRLPWWAWATLAGLAAVGAAAAAGWHYFPNGWREPAVRTFYLGYLAVLTVVWVGLLACTLAGLYVPIALFDRWLKSIPREADRRWAELSLICGYAVSVVAVAALIPTTAVLAACLLAAAVAAVAAARPVNRAPAVLWRAGPDRPVYSIPLARLAAVLAGAVALLVFDLLLFANGGRLSAWGDLPESMPLTSLVGTTAAWLVPGAAALAGFRVWVWSRGDPARRTPPTVHVRRGKDTPAFELEQAAAVVARWGWKVRLDPDPARPGDVGIELVPADRSEATEFDPGWPLKVSLADLTAGAVRERLDRRDEIQLRRVVGRGLEAIFKQAAAERGRKKGGGYWFAPHWWFVDGLGREEADKRGRKADDANTLRPVGPPFAVAFGPRPRQHLHRVLRAVQIDMIFVEAGVSHRTLTRVLRQTYELFDMHAGRRKAEDHHYRGIPKVRVMVHDYTTDGRFRPTGYPEPQFDDLSRARVLHVFRDRGDQEELEDVPFDFSWEPSPMIGVG